MRTSAISCSSVSAATVDRLLAKTKRQTLIKGRSTTRPGTLLKHHIPVRTFADWNDVQPGFCEADLVAHDGGSAFGDYCHSLNLTDVASTWTETIAVQNKAQIHVFEGLKLIRAQMPFPLLGLDSDNGSEFINERTRPLLRGRTYHLHPEPPLQEKRQLLMSNRKTTPSSAEPWPITATTHLHNWRCSTRSTRTLRLYTNFFLPVMKLQEKVRSGSKLSRRYDAPLTPYKRLLAILSSLRRSKTSSRPNTTP